MKSTPNFAWPVAEGADPVKQYPAAVDDPFKASLDTLLAKALPGGAVPALRGRYSGSLSAGTGRLPITFNVEKQAWGGMAFNDADGTVIVPKAGVYHLSGSIIFWQITDPAIIVQADVGSLTARYGWGGGRIRLPNNYATDSFAMNKLLAAGDKVSLWATVSVASVAVEGAALNIEWIGAAS